MGIDGDRERGRVCYKKLRSEERAITRYRRTYSTSSELVYTGEIVPGWNEDFTTLWNEALDEANLREKEKGRLCNSRVSTSFRGMWRKFLRCRREKINGSISKQARDFAIFLRDLGKDYTWSRLCLQEFTASNGEVVSETQRATRCSSRSHARGTCDWPLWCR